MIILFEVRNLLPCKKKTPNLPSSKNKTQNNIYTPNPTIIDYKEIYNFRELQKDEQENDNHYINRNLGIKIFCFNSHTYTF